MVIANTALSSKFQRISIAIGISLAIAGLAAFSLLILRATQSQPILPGIPLLGPISAFSVTIGGLSLWMSASEGRLLGRTGKAASLLVITGACVVLAEPLLGFEALVIRGLALNEGVLTGRGAALGFLLIGLALFTLDLEIADGWRPAQWMSLAVALLALLGSLGAPLLAQTRVWGVAPGVATILIGFSIGLLSARPEHGIMNVAVAQSSSGSVFRRAFGVSVLILLILIGITSLMSAQFGFLVAGVTDVLLVAAIWRTASSLREQEGERQWFIDTLERSHRDLEGQLEEQALHVRQIEDELETENGDRRRAQQELSHTRQELAELFDNRLLGLRWVAADGAIMRANRAELEMLGYSEEEYIGHHISEFYVDREMSEDVLRRLARGETTEGHESRLRAKDGSVRYVQVNPSVFGDENGGFKALFVTCDVTDRKRIEYELAQLLAREHAMRAMAEDAEVRYHNFVHGLDAIVWEADATTLRFTFVSRRAESILGHPIQRWLREPDFWTSIIHPDDRDRAVELCRTATREGIDQEFEYRAITADGRIVWLHDKVYVVRDKEGQPERLRGLMVDITGRKRAEDERALLLISEQAAREEAERAVEMVRRLQGMADVALSHLGLDDLLQQMVGRIRELLRTDCAIIALIGDDGKTLTERAVVGLEGVDLDIRNVLCDGIAGRVAAERLSLVMNDLPIDGPIAEKLGLRSRSLIGAPLMLDDRLIGVVHTHTTDRRQFSEDDVKLLELAADRVAMTIERARLYEAEQRARVEAEDANRMKDEFLATLSHELRSPLNAILGWVVLLRQGKLDEEATARALETVEFSARSQNRMINDLLDVSRIISGKLRLSVRPLQPSRIIEAAVEALRPAAEAKGIVLDVELDSNAGPISADSDRLQQIVWNLVSNAIRFTPRAGRVEVRLQRTNATAEISVKDTGVGIAPEFLPFVFDRFRQADSSSRRKQGGLGIGLAIVRHLVEMQGGTVEARSAGEGQGATFLARLPVIAANVPVIDRLALFAKEDIVRSEKYDLQGVRVLVVDDESGARELVASILGPERMEVRTVASVNEALSLLADWVPDVLLSDIEMPDVDGYSFIRQVRSLPDERSHIPAVALTAYARMEDRMRAIAAGFQIHIAKPIEPVQLLTALSAVMSRSNLSRAGQSMEPSL